MNKYHAANFKKSAYYAIRGLRIAIRTQPNVRKHFYILISMLIIAIFSRFEPWQFALLLATSLFVVVCELFNSAIELTLDAYYKNKFSNMVKMAKDVSAGAVLLAAIANALVFAFLLLDAWL